VEIIVKVFADRTRLGKLEVRRGGQLIAGPFRCYAKSDNQAAAAAGNPSRDPMHHMGDLPLGRYWLEPLPPGKPERSYGPGIRYLMNPTGGPALKAKKRNGRIGIEIHGGPLATMNMLRPTHGCLRVDDSTIEAIERCAPWRCTVKLAA
jgi:hypothetical protein